MMWGEQLVRLKDKVAIVTGAASGMGAATAEMFAREGAKVMLTDLMEEEGMAVVERINTAGGKAQFLRHDVSSDTEWDVVVAGTLEAFSRIDVLVNNAGISGIEIPVDGGFLAM